MCEKQKRQTSRSAARVRLSTGDKFAYGKEIPTPDGNLGAMARFQNTFDAAGGAAMAAGSAFIFYYLYQALTFSPADDECLHPVRDFFPSPARLPGPD